MLNVDLALDQERVEIFRDRTTGAVGVVALHSTVLGPAMGGLRLHAYGSLTEATTDALRLSEAMSLKNAAAGLPLGGGKAVLVDDGGWAPGTARADRMRAVGRVVDELGGRYITAEDVGTTPQDMEHIGEATRWVAGRPVDCGGRGDPSPATARTVFGAIEAAARLRLGAGDLGDVHVGVQGVGHVGAALVALLREAGAEVTLTDAVARRAVAVADRLGARAVEPLGFVTRPFDVLAPCALGDVIDARHVADLRCSVVAGAANNPLADGDADTELARAGILYVPDFLANCGGIIHVGGEALGFGDDEVQRLIRAAIDRTETLLRHARDQDRTPREVAVAYAQARIAGAPVALEAAA
jgi:leucine dehydrogenase